MKFMYRECVAIVSAVKGIDKTSIVIADSKDIETLLKNRNLLSIHSDVYTLKSTPLAEFEKFRSEVSRVKRAGGANIVGEIESLEKKYKAIIDAEEARRLEAHELYTTEIQVEGIVKLKRSAVKAQTAQDIAFITAIDKILED